MRAISRQVVSTLGDIRKKVESRMVRMWGPESILAEAGATAPEVVSNPPNPGTASDAVDAYLSEIVDRMIYEYEWDEADAIDFVLSCAAELSSLPPLTDNDDEAANTAWLGAASTVGFSGYCLGRARSA